MDCNHKRKGFMKVKIPSFGSRPSKSSSPLNSNSEETNMINQQAHYSTDYLLKKDVSPQGVKKVSFVVPITSDEARYGSTHQESFYFGAIADEYVNMRASNYISSVRERFRLERLNSERRVSQEISS